MVKESFYSYTYLQGNMHIIFDITNTTYLPISSCERTLRAFNNYERTGENSNPECKHTRNAQRVASAKHDTLSFLFASTKIRDDTSMRCQSDARHYYKNLKLLFPFLHPISKQFTLASLCLIKNFLSTETRYKRGTLNSKKCQRTQSLNTEHPISERKFFNQE